MLKTLRNCPVQLLAADLETRNPSKSEDWSPARLGRAVLPPMLWPSALREQLPWRNEVALAARAATARTPARQGQPIPSNLDSGECGDFGVQNGDLGFDSLELI
jgi:hypothetical protein